MGTNNNIGTSVDLESLVESHDRPFVVIDRHYNILATNRAYQTKFGMTSEETVGCMCYQISHGKSRPCGEEGEDCPLDHVFRTGQSTVCAHVHLDADRNVHHVKVAAFPLRASDGEVYLGEEIEEVEVDIPRPQSSTRMVGSSPAFLACIEQLTVASSSDAPVLLQGETGTGKELAAEFIHQHSSRSLQPFQIVDSTALTETLFETEMFGHVKGAFTGTTGDKQGLFELAEGGTIFLDEIGELPLSQQAKLLRVLESGQYRRVGGKSTRKANVRIICASNRHLWESVLSGDFREDLYYRIGCLNIRLPGLRERLEDVPQLARTLMEAINRSMRSSYHLADDAFESLKQYSYPGNVRELRNILFIAATHSHDHVIDAALVSRVIGNLPQSNGVDERRDIELESTLHNAGVESAAPPSGPAPTLREIEKQHILELIDRYDGNRKQVADTLGISERTVYRKLRKLGITNRAG